MIQRIIVIRRDNIGDLICSTPLIHSLRTQWPNARIDALVTDYNAAALLGNPDISKIYSYQKAKHRGNESYLGIYTRRLKTLISLRLNRYNLAILPGGPNPSALRFAHLCGAEHVVIRDDSDIEQHEVEHCCTLLTKLGLNYTTPNLILTPPVSTKLCTSPAKRPVIGLHISARKPSQRWPAERFVQFAHICHQAIGATFLLFWSPGSVDNPQHPGDDEKAREIIEQCRDLPLYGVPSHELPELIAGLARCDHVVCSDGGAMHIAAALGKPIVCFFGNSNSTRWHPWGVPYELIQPPSFEVADISVDEALAAYDRLHKRLE